MIKVHIPPNMSPISFDFGPGVERTKKGALYLTPGSVKFISDSEWAWIRKHRPMIAKQLWIEHKPILIVEPTPVVKKLVSIPKKEEETLVEDITEQAIDEIVTTEEVIEDTIKNDTEDDIIFSTSNKKKKKKRKKKQSREDG